MARAAAETIYPLLGAVLGDQLRVRLRCWDGSVAGPPDASVHLTLRRRRALRRLLWAPNELGLARAFVSGDLDVDGDLFESLAQLDRVVHPERGEPIRADRTGRVAALKAALRLGVLGPPPKPPVEEVRLAGRRHSLRRDASAIAHHYNLSNEFYGLVLGPSMTYSCAYWTDEAKDLTEAQTAKHDLVARKLELRPGMRVLDVGCGWGGFVRHAAREYGARAVGITLSTEQAEFARKRVAEEGLGDLVEIRVQDYREIQDGPYDAIASVGMAEHVGAAGLPGYAATLFELLTPRGRLLNHAISRRPEFTVRKDKSSFIDRYVFPDGELEPLGVQVSALEQGGFEVRDVQSLREHYARTLRAWVDNLRSGWAEAVRLTSIGRARVWQLYMSACALTFAIGRIGVNQVLAIRPDTDGGSGMPAVRRI
ncbi:cyclopropane-fatty-acyl-phospholipid synthase [Tamaricihabitans halophyticus]|uniref:Cyclopropane-fatty-acyl-phospholipid synthase n=1 Tax=Tamaricihabitans halophyticus TaxID=1262583 RepID=A0A4R2QYJ0_9PSEU|nr:cyclopropane-fatty-acyl-phospholipid synthase family protein [Tamaricihabitans halophyticus]TCP55273.1 cyclopropane-fatty-acyl-phospholipid synthase [Tamaricihabitans halophyticus]